MSLRPRLVRHCRSPMTQLFEQQPSLYSPTPNSEGLQLMHERVSLMWPHHFSLKGAWLCAFSLLFSFSYLCPALFTKGGSWLGKAEDALWRSGKRQASWGFPLRSMPKGFGGENVIPWTLNVSSTLFLQWARRSVWLSTVLSTLRGSSSASVCFPLLEFFLNCDFQMMTPAHCYKLTGASKLRKYSER